MGVRIMTYQQPQPSYPATLVFNSVEGFLHAVQQRSITEIGCATLKRIKPFEGGMLQRHIWFVLLTARDHTRDEVLACSVLLKAGDFEDDKHLWTPADEWQRQERVPSWYSINCSDAYRRSRLCEFWMPPTTCIPTCACSFASFSPQAADDDTGTGSVR